MEYVLSVSFCIMEMLAVSIIADALFQRRFLRSWVHYILVVSSGIFSSILVTVASGIVVSFLKATLSIGMYFLILHVMYKGKMSSKLLMAAAFFPILYAVDNVVMMSVMQMLDFSYLSLVQAKGVYILSAFTAKILLLILAALFGRILEQRCEKISVKLDISSWAFLLLIPLLSIFIMILLVNDAIYKGRIGMELFILTFGLWACDIAVVFLWKRLENTRRFELENKLLQQEVRGNMETITALENAYRQQRRQTHDFDNHMQIIQGLLSIGKVEKALHYVQEWTKMPAPAYTVIETNNSLIDTVLTQKYLAAKEKSVHMAFSLEDLSRIPIGEAELITVLANLLDNAIEAAAECRMGKEVRVKMGRLSDQSFLCSVRNTSNPVQIVDGTIHTTKVDVQAHGFGISNVVQIVKNSGGTYSISQKDGWVQFVVLFPPENN